LGLNRFTLTSDWRRCAGKRAMIYNATIAFILRVPDLDPDYESDLALAASSVPTPTSSNQAPLTMKTNEDIIPRPTT
jgi:hypothetical protein